MSESQPTNPPKNSPGSRLLNVLLGIEIILLLALAQVFWSGYRLGVGNQSIQIPFLKQSADPSLYKSDVMVEQTQPFYSSFFFKGLGKFVGAVDPLINRAAKSDPGKHIDPVIPVYFWLHVLTAACALGAAYGLGRVMFKNRAAGVMLVLLLLGGHHKALAGDDLYSLGFTHTFAVFPMAMLAMLLLYKNWLFPAFALLGLIFNLHALSASYLFVMFMAWAVIEYRRPAQWWRLILMTVLFIACAVPTLLPMIKQKQIFTAQWLELTRMRSADHSFASTWWSDGSTDIPHFLLLLGLAAVSLSFMPAGVNRRKSVWMLAGVLFLFTIGFIFSDLWPSTTVIRAQLFRSSRFLMVLMLAHIAFGIVSGFALLRRNRHASANVELTPDLRAISARIEPQPIRTDIINPDRPIGILGRFLEMTLALSMLICVGVPNLMGFAPWVLAGAILIALLNRRLSGGQALVGSIALLVSLMAWKTIEFHLPGINENILAGLTKTWETLGKNAWQGGKALLIAVSIAAAVSIILALRTGPRVRLCALVGVHFACVMLALFAYVHLSTNGASQDAWAKTQFWAKQKAPADAVFLTPVKPGGFRIFSERAVVCEWRDGTQLYFAADYARDWGKKLNAIKPAVYTIGNNAAELSSGKSLEDMSDREIIALSKEYNATHVVLPAGKPRNLRVLYENDKWAVYEPKPSTPDGADKDAWAVQTGFVESVSNPGIEKHRKGDAVVELLDAQGRALASVSYDIKLVNHAFNFGCSLPPFQTINDDYSPEWVPNKNSPRQLDLVKGVFNYSVIPFSGKWNHIQPEEGKHDYADLDEYVNWCVKNNIRMEFHYLSGFMPRWVRQKPTLEQKEIWFEHCRKTVERYQDRIKVWQVVNDTYMINYAAEIITELQKKYPDLRFGVSHCSKFYSSYSGASADRDLYLGLSDAELVKTAGGKLHFFSTHGHKPNGVWPDAQLMHKVLDGLSADGLRVHISEATLDIGLAMFGAMGTGKWTDELAADFWEQYYTVAFGHPAVDAINYWDLSESMFRGGGGPGGGGQGRPGGGISGGMIQGTGQAGLLDPKLDDAPRLTYLRIKELIKQRWHTKLTGRSGGDAKIAFRGFYGEYEVTATLPDGKTVKGRFAIQKEGDNKIQVKLSADGQSLVKG